MKKTIMSALLFIVFSGCAALQADYQKRSCNYEAGYEAGVNAAQAGQPMNSSAITNQCEEASKIATARGYTEGYMTIKKSPVININTNQLQAVKRCRARQGKEIHENFCSDISEFNCKAHSMCLFN